MYYLATCCPEESQSDERARQKGDVWTGRRRKAQKEQVWAWRVTAEAAWRRWEEGEWWFERRLWQSTEQVITDDHIDGRAAAQKERWCDKYAPRSLSLSATSSFPNSIFHLPPSFSSVETHINRKQPICLLEASCDLPLSSQYCLPLNSPVLCLHTSYSGGYWSSISKLCHRIVGSQVWNPLK